MTLPDLTQFRLEIAANQIAHLIFDCPGRSMNVFSDAAIVDLAAVAGWLPDAEVKGLLIRSGKDSAFCAGADLNELGVAYDMIIAAPARSRFDLAFDHFFRLGRAMRALETAGKPVAAAIAGLALGGGCELALTAHYRVVVDEPSVAMGLPESLVGLLPGAGGTQRLPRLIGMDLAMPILLDGARLAGKAALAAGLADRIVSRGEEIAAAEAWLLGTPTSVQPWDRPDWSPAIALTVSQSMAPLREAVLAKSLGHYPALLAILDCVEFGLPQVFDGAIRTEMAIFSHLIQRAEPRDMIQTLFLAKTEYDRAVRRDAIPDFVKDAVAAAKEVIGEQGRSEAGRRLGFEGAQGDPVRTRSLPGYWVDGPDEDARNARALLDRIGAAVLPLGQGRAEAELRLADYAIVRETGYPGYLGGPFAFQSRARRG